MEISKKNMIIKVLKYFPKNSNDCISDLCNILGIKDFYSLSKIIKSIFNCYSVEISENGGIEISINKRGGFLFSAWIPKEISRLDLVNFIKNTKKVSTIINK